ncbi:unnamed protein product [Closterium sp. NIES-64]|nr:unnamed protein product [Closterium sp. NIES-64]
MIDHEPVAMRAVEDDGTLPRYSQDELRRMTGDWRTKLGEGGFGAVYKGMLLLPHGGARGGGYGEGVGGGYGEGVGGGWGERDHEEEVQGGMGPGINDDLEVVQVGGKEFVPVAVKMCLTDNAEGGAREQLLTEIIPMTALHAFSLSLPFPSPSINPLHPSFSYGAHDDDCSTPSQHSRPLGVAWANHQTPRYPPLSDAEILDPKAELIATEVMMMTALHHPNILRLLGVAVMGQTLAMVSEFVPGGDVSQRLKKDGVWKDGVWKDGVWKDGVWKDGVWKDGVWKDGVWKDGVWKDGVWKDGVWKDGGESSWNKPSRSDTEPFPWKDRLRIARGSLEGLAAIHREGFIHRDFKSANVLLTKVCSYDVLLTKALVLMVADLGLANA